MKQIIAAMLLMIFSYHSFAQTKKPADIQMISDYGAISEELSNILDFQDIDYFRVKFVGKGVTDKYYSLIVKEIWDGKIRNVDTLCNTRTRQKIGKTDKDTLSLTVYGMRSDSNKLKVNFRFQRFGVTRKYDAVNSDDYSLRSIGNKLEILPNKYFHAFAYILPYEQDGWKMYCAVDQSGKDVETWGTVFGIKHYLLFEMMFE